jgi:hypothetical protein
MTFRILASRSMGPDEIRRTYTEFHERFRLLSSLYELTQYRNGTAGEDYRKDEFESHLRSNSPATNLAEGLPLLWGNGRESPVVVGIGGSQKPKDLVSRLKGYEQFDLYAPINDYKFFQRMLNNDVPQGGKFIK